MSEEASTVDRSSRFPPVRLSQLGTCAVCASTRRYYLFSAGNARALRCNDCGLLSSDAPVSDAESGGLDAIIGRPGPPLDASPTLSMLLEYAGAARGRLLLVDARMRDLADAAVAAGFEVTVLDPAGIWHTPTGTRPLHLQPARLSTLAATGAAPFDVIVLGDALNHVATPRAQLETAHALLKPGGILLASTPSLNDWGRTSSEARRPDDGLGGAFYFGGQQLETLMFQTWFRELIVRSTDATGRTNPRNGGACLVLGRSAPVRPRPLLSVIVAAYNERPTVDRALERLLAKRIPGLDIEVIIVESNSTDGTRELVRRYAEHPGVTLVLEDRPRGKGHAVRTGLARATGDFVLIQDADLEYDLEDYDVLLEPLVAGREAFVLGARHGGQTWKIRRFTDQPVQASVLNFAHRAFTALINVSCGLRLNDPFTMYKVFRRDCLFGLRLECNRFDFDWELLIKLVRKGYQPLEIPVNYRSRSFKEGKKVRMFRDPLTWLRAWAKARFGRLR